MEKIRKQFVAAFTAIVLALVFVLPQAAVFAETVQTSWEEEIPALLSAGNYAEGEVIAGVVTYGKEITGDYLLSGSEEILDVTEEDLANEEISILYIQREDMTTEQILTRLSYDRRVLFAEPNYISETADFSESEASSDLTPTVRTEDIADLTGLQWSNWDEASFHIEGNANTSMHVPNFGPTGSNMDNEVIVAVLDEPIDYKNPDLANKVYHFSAEEQAVLGCGEWGYNATAQSIDGVPVYLSMSSHGTHCGGIIGAEWDGKGISGVGSNVKLLSIQLAAEDGKTSLVNVLRGFAFIDKARSNGINISLTSNSYSLCQASRALNAAVENLGEKWGIISIFAAGNDDRDIAEIGIIQGMLQENPYVIEVAATDSSGNITYYSNFGQGQIDLGAPGSGILSSVTADAATYLADATPSTNKYYEGFENADVSLEVVQIDQNEKPVSAEIIVTDQSGLAGTHSLEITRDPNYELFDMEYGKMMGLRMSFGNVSEMGVQPGDYFGFAAGGVGAIVFDRVFFRDIRTGDLRVLKPLSNQTITSMNGWNNLYYKIPDSIDLTKFDILLTIILPYDLDTFYMDSFGFGTELVPYAFMDGTSMAAPAVSGAAAVLKSQYPDASGEELVSLVKALVTPDESLAEKTKTGGRLDFLAVPDSVSGPAIRQLEVSGETAVISGTGFTDSGMVTLTKEVAGKDPEVKTFSVSSWTDTEVVLNLEEEFKGVMQVVLENNNQKTDTLMQFINKSDNIYEEDLPFNKETGMPFAFDRGGDWETQGPLIGFEDKLYYLPAETRCEISPAYRKLLVYDISNQTWSEETSLPEYLEKVSAAAYNGKIVVKGSSMELHPDGSPESSEEAQPLIYVYDPASDSWSAGSAEGVSLEDALSVKGDSLILAGDSEISSEPGMVRYYDLSTGAGEVIAEIESIAGIPSVVCKDDSIYIFDAGSYSFSRIQDGKEQILDSALPDYLVSGEQEIYLPEFEVTERDGILLSVPEGILFVGPTAEDGSGDTYVLKDGQDRFEPYEKRMSDSKVSFAAAAYYNGKVYALGSAAYEDQGRFFRATNVAAYGDFVYEVQNDGTVTITGCRKKTKKIEVPGEIDGRPVTRIGKKAFQSCNNLLSVYIPVSVTKIGSHAFPSQNGFVIFGTPKTAAETYAKKNGYTFVDASKPFKKLKNPLTVSPKKIILKASKLKKKNRYVSAAAAFKTDKAQGKVTYKVTAYDKQAKKKIKVSSAGKVTVKKGLAKGTYKVKVKVKASGNELYKAKSKTVILTIKVK